MDASEPLSEKASESSSAAVPMLGSSAMIRAPTLSAALSVASAASSVMSPVAVSATDLSAWVMTTPLESLKTGTLFRVSRSTAAAATALALSSVSAPAASRYVATAVRVLPISPAFGA